MHTFAVFFLLLSAPPARAAAGGEAMPFLKLDTGARGAALSGAYTAPGDDALSVFYNPAGTALAGKQEILLGHNEWLVGIRNETLAYLRPLGPGLTVFGGFNALFSGSMGRYDAAGAADGTFSAMEAAVSAGLAGDLGNNFYGGAALKALSQQAAGMKAMAWAGDAGLLKVAGDWKIGAAASNFGGRLKLGSGSFGLPFILRAGIAANLIEDLMLSAEAVKAGKSAAAAAFGAEARVLAGPRQYFVFRAGYKTGRSRYAGTGFTAGVGLINRELSVDYAYAPYGELGDAHRVTVSLKFGKRRPAAPVKHPGLPPARVNRKERQSPRPETPSEAEKKKKDKKAAGEVYFMW